jgi:thiol-disulfide isomerase/thioredoxin
MTAGLIAVAVALVAATVIGLWRRSSDGRLRVAAAAVPATGPAPAPSPASVPAPAPSPPPSAVLSPELLDALGVDRTAGATLLQFSSAFCQPCRAVRRISSEVAAMVPGVRHVEVDAESHLDAVRALNIWRTPTLLILDSEGREVRRATGIPGKPQLIAALGQVLDA